MIRMQRKPEDTVFICNFISYIINVPFYSV